MKIESERIAWGSGKHEHRKFTDELEDFVYNNLTDEIEGNDLTEARTVAFRCASAIGRLVDVLASKQLLTTPDVLTILGITGYKAKELCAQIIAE